MTTVIIVAGVVAVAAAVAGAVKLRRPDAPSSANFAVPQQLDRNDFAAKEPWLFVLFSSQTCLACIDAREVIQVDALDGIASEEVQFEQDRELHRRYDIDSVPTVVLADADGVVQWSFVGPPPLEAFIDVLMDIGAAPPDDGTAVAIT